LAWVEVLARNDGVVDQVYYKVCRTIETKERLIVAELDSLYKHIDCKKAKVDTLGMVKGMIYYCPKYVHKNMKHCMLLVFITMLVIN
jgi:hypothetical protein